MRKRPELTLITLCKKNLVFVHGFSKRKKQSKRRRRITMISQGRLQGKSTYTLFISSKERASD